MSNWIKGRPTTPGNYWVSTKTYKYIILVVYYDGDIKFYVPGSDYGLSMEKLITEYYMPVVEPTLPTE